MLVRAIRLSDLDDLLALATLVGPGMTTLKPDRAALGQRVELACASFAGQVEQRQRDYLFVMEDPANARVVGVCAMSAPLPLRLVCGCAGSTPSISGWTADRAPSIRSKAAFSIIRTTTCSMGDFGDDMCVQGGA